MSDDLKPGDILKGEFLRRDGSTSDTYVVPWDQTIDGHKIFVHQRNELAVVEMVNDERPFVRMKLTLTPQEAREISQVLADIAEASGA